MTSILLQRRGICSLPLLRGSSCDIVPLRTIRLYASNVHANNGFDVVQGRQLPQSVDLLDRYRGLVTRGKIKYDEEQIRIIMQLRRLQRELDGYAPPALLSKYLGHGGRSESYFSELTPWWTPYTQPECDTTAESQALVRISSHAEELAELTTPKGLLVTGPPGSGKSFVIDLWYSGVPTPFKARKHYSELVLEIYRAVWEETKHRTATVHQDDVILPQPPIASWSRVVRDRWRELLKSNVLPTRWVRTPSSVGLTANIDSSITFNIQLLDVSSAGLLADVLSWYWRMGGVIVGSSNKIPEDLYQNGVQKERLEPFVEALKARCPVVTMRSEHDWRAIRAQSSIPTHWFTYGREEEFQQMLNVYSEKGRPRDLNVFGRRLHVPWSIDGACKFNFSELCDESLGPADYMTLASTFHTMVITSIPVLKLSTKNQARRFISLIDALYESRCRLICLAEAPPHQLFFPDAEPSNSETQVNQLQQLIDVDVMMAEAVAETQDIYRPNVSSYDSPLMREAPQAPSSPLALDKLSIFSGKDEQFAFKRALSRLLEMTSDNYAEQEQWAPLPQSSRKWEQPSPAPEAIRSRPHRLRWTSAARPETPSRSRTGEAISNGSTRLRERPEAPRFSEAHVWGIAEEGGEGAKARRRGARASRKQSSLSDVDQNRSRDGT